VSGVDLVLELVDTVVFDVGDDRAVAVMRRDVSKFNVELGIGQNVMAVDVNHAGGFVVESVDGQVVLLVRARNVVVEVAQKRSRAGFQILYFTFGKSKVNFLTLLLGKVK